MSARQPFIPQRPPAGISPQTTGESKAADEPFRPTGLLNDPVGHDSNHHLPGINKPLNTAGFKKKHDPRVINGNNNNRSRKSLDNATRAARSPAPNHSRIAAPVPSSPFFPNNPSLLPVRDPRVLSPSQLSSASADNILSSNQAHIPGRNSTPGSATTDRRLPPRPSNLSSVTRAPTPYQTLDKIDEDHEVEDTAQLSSPPDVQRNGISHPSLHDVSRQGLRRISKRVRRMEDEGSEDSEYGVVTKRYKADETGQIDYMQPYPPQSTPGPTVPLRNSSVVPSTPVRNHQTADSSAPSNSILHRILGPSLERHADKDLEAYMNAKKKWSECTIEEWKAGANDIAANFAKMIDYVKDHMTTKLALYANLQSVVEDHRTVLNERETVLRNARDSLVRDGANVVGNAKH
ncbi:hypothetical protein C8Q75DRAFT_751922 [Abortiporus biennis]|nr:hypothetical protein C8Q75DRAFT_751922 [Abortiporus biennis]